MRTTLVAIIAAAALGAAGCATKPMVGAEKAVASALISTEEENKLGDQVHQELEKQGIKYITDPTVTQYVENIARPIIQQAKKERPDVSWHIHVVDTKDVNAFATPGGHLYVNSGLILAASNESELAGVMAHEAGHVVGRHSARNMVQAYGLQTVASLALGQNPSLLKQLAASVVANGVLLHHTRSQETEADEYGALFTSRGGYDPNGLISFFQTLQKQEGKVPGVLVWLSDHPATGDRISHLQEFIAKNKLRRGPVNTLNQLAAVQQRVRQVGTGGAGPK